MELAVNKRRSTSAASAGMALTPPQWLKAGVMFLLLGATASSAASSVAPTDWLAHGAWCIVGLLIAAALMVKALRAGFVVVLTDHLVVFLGAFCLYFLFGASLLAFGPEQDIVHSLAYYPVDARMALRVDGVNAIGFGVALIAAAISPRGWFKRQTDRVALVSRRVSAPLTMFILLSVGTAALLNNLSVDIGLRHGTVSGIWRELAQFALVAIYLGASYRGRYERWVRAAGVLITPLAAVGGLLQFSKTAMLLPLAALVVGLAVRYGGRKIIPIGLPVLIGIFMASGGIVAYSRTALDKGDPANFSQRRIILEEGLSASLHDERTALYSPWARLSYVTSEAAAIDFYDDGMGGHDFRLIPWLFIPRTLAPSKPIITQTSYDFNTKVTGNAGSSTGQGIFASGYYSGGWLGTIGASALCGWILAQTSAVAVIVLARTALLLLPFALLGVHIAFRIDGSFLADYFGAFIFILYPLLGASFVLGAVRRR